MSKCLFIISFLLLVTFPNSLLADNIYQWTDESGKIHFGDIPKNTENVLIFEKPTIQNISMAKTKTIKTLGVKRLKKSKKHTKPTENQCVKITQTILEIEEKLNLRQIASKFDSYNHQLKKLRWKKIKNC